MIRINLLPKIQRRSEIPFHRLSLLVVLVLVLVLTGIWGLMTYSFWSTEQELADLKTRHTELGPVELAMEQAGSKQMHIDAKKSLIDQLDKTRSYPYNVLPRIVAAMTDNVWLEQTKVGPVGKGNIEVQGGALSYPDLTGFVSRLEADNTFSVVTLKSLEGDRKEGIMKFTIEIKLKGMQ